MRFNPRFSSVLQIFKLEAHKWETGTGFLTVHGCRRFTSLPQLKHKTRRL